MKGLSVKLALGAVAAALALSAPAEARYQRASHGGGAEAKVHAYCMTCHNSGARGFMGYMPVPQIAGLPAEYIQIQLKAFVERRRQRNLGFIKYDRVHGIPEGQRKAIAEYVSSLPPSAHPSGSSSLVAQGEKIFHGGAPDNDVPACAVCHGPEAKGEGIFPRLAGQWRPYLINKLANWDRERGLGPNGGDDNSQIMKPIAKSMTKDQIRAVSAYLSSLK
jgi:cytochrome c553